MNFQLQDKIAVITGSTAGIGVLPSGAAKRSCQAMRQSEEQSVTRAHLEEKLEPHQAGLVFYLTLLHPKREHL